MSAAQAVFIGGTGRSGTTVLGRLLGRHSTHAMIPVEVRLHAEPRGLPSVLEESIEPKTWAQLVRDRWFVTGKHPRHPTGGLHRIIREADLQRALEAFVAVAEVDRVAACRSLLTAILDPVAAGEGKSNWVEMTPRNILHGSHLLKMFPDAKIVHVVRDGRDVARSLSALGWITDTRAGVEWWAARLRQARRRTRALDPSRAYTVNFEDLLLHHRTATYEALVDFLGWEDEPELRRFFSEQMLPEQAHVGRWQKELSAHEASALDKRYHELVEELRSEEAPSQAGGDSGGVDYPTGVTPP